VEQPVPRLLHLETSIGTQRREDTPFHR